MSDTTAPERLHIQIDHDDGISYDGLIGKAPFKNFNGDVVTTEYIRADLYEKKRAAHLKDAVALGRALEEIERFKAELDSQKRVFMSIMEAKDVLVAHIDRLEAELKDAKKHRNPPWHKPPFTNDIAQEGG